MAAIAKLTPSNHQSSGNVEDLWAFDGTENKYADVSRRDTARYYAKHYQPGKGPISMIPDSSSLGEISMEGTYQVWCCTNQMYDTTGRHKTIGGDIERRFSHIFRSTRSVRK